MSSEAASPSSLIEGLLRSSVYPRQTSTELIETHISWVLLAGDFAYKIKKPVRFGFVDFSTLDRRKHCCVEELRLNRRYSPDIYLAVVPITGTIQTPRIDGHGTPIEYAVKMLRFPSEGLFDRLLEHHQLMPEHVCRLAETVALFHHGLTQDEEIQADRFKLAREAVEDNFSTIRTGLSEKADLSDLAMLHDWTHQEYARQETLLWTRVSEGCIRECHGDLHLGNIVWLHDNAKLFDGIDFNADLRWIDTFNELAFPVMDLEVRGAQHLAYLLLNRYLELTGDYAGIPLLDYYRLYRALVRAKVAILRLGQTTARTECLVSCRSYIRYGLSLTQRRNPTLIIMHGLSGCGKSRLAAQLATLMPAICVRSDIERKRLSKEAVNAAAPPDLYGPDRTNKTYARLLDIAAAALRSGHSVILDATFLQRSHRSEARRLAVSTGAKFRLLDLNASPALLKERVHNRQTEGNDPSDADDRVIALQMKSAQNLEPDEIKQSIFIDAASPIDPAEVLMRING